MVFLVLETSFSFSQVVYERSAGNVRAGPDGRDKVLDSFQREALKCVCVVVGGWWQDFWNGGVSSSVDLLPQ